jgi:hypothetical protein
MPLGYYGYAKLANIFLLANSGGLNRRVDPIRSEAVWGAGWYTGAQHTNYADNQTYFEGNLSFELQGISSVWNLIVNWLVENRVTPQSLIISPDGLVIESYLATPGDTRSGAILQNAGFTIDPERAISVNCTAIALKRQESYSSGTYRTQRVGPGIPTAPLNPFPHNRNPFPGWSAFAQIIWPGSPPYMTATNPTGMFLQGADFTFNNNTQVIKGCTGLPNPAVVFQGTMAVEGTVRLLRDGAIPDPYAIPNTPFRADGASLNLLIGQQAPVPQILFDHILLMSEDFTIQGQNTPVPRTFGFAGLGDGTGPPMRMPLLAG